MVKPSRNQSAPNIKTAPSPQQQFQTQIQALLKRQQYRQAIDEIHKIQRSQPEWIIDPSEADIWLLRGKQEFEKADFRQAENSLHQALKLGLAGETHYWLAKCYLARNRLEKAIEFLQTAFQQETLPKDYSICYPKLLLLKGETATVEQLITQQSKRFTAAQLHWLRGVLALKAQQPQTALAAFQKVKRPLTPGDRPELWQIYTQQAHGNWEAAAIKLGIGEGSTQRMRLLYGTPKYTEHPFLQRFALLHHLKTGQPPLEQMRFRAGEPLIDDAVAVLSLLEFLKDSDPHEAGHILLKFDKRSTRFPELATLRPALLTLAGQQAFDQRAFSCAEDLWQPLLTEQPFNSQLAINFLEVLDENKSYQEQQRLLTRLIKWLGQEAKQNPQSWPQEKLNLTLAHARCRLADIWMKLDRFRAALGEIQQAERLAPQSPEVIGRRGLIAYLEDNHQEATALLTQAIEGGCRYDEVYDSLLESWEELGNAAAVKEARRRFGKYFGDLRAETEVEVAPWLDALSTQSYSLFSHLVQAEKDQDPALRACQIFVKTVHEEANTSGRVSFDQAQAVKQWEALLQGLSPQEQVQPLLAIALCLLLFTKRVKGITALINQYFQQLSALGQEQTEAREAHLVVLALKEKDSPKLQSPLRLYLDTQPQPGNALAQIQLKLRRFTQTLAQAQTLRPFIEEALRREPQNPLLLLAKATTYPTDGSEYEEFKQQGFEIARRLQDAKALQAFREEQSIVNAQEVQDILPNPAAFEDFDLDDMDDFLESLIRKIAGSKIPPNELQRALPELKKMMLESMPDFDDDDEDEDEGGFGFGFPFGNNASKSKKSGKKGR